jgi:hypothetical protein
MCDCAHLLAAPNTLRDAISRVPLHEPVCDDCKVAFVTNVCELCEERRRLAKGRVARDPHGGLSSL